jgi:hypothetical protein
LPRTVSSTPARSPSAHVSHILDPGDQRRTLLLEFCVCRVHYSCQRLCRLWYILLTSCRLGSRQTSEGELSSQYRHWRNTETYLVDRPCPFKLLQSRLHPCKGAEYSLSLLDLFFLVAKELQRGGKDLSRLVYCCQRKMTTDYGTYQACSAPPQTWPTTPNSVGWAEHQSIARRCCSPCPVRCTVPPA